MTQKNLTLSKLIDDVKYIVDNSKNEEDISITLYSMKNHKNIHNDIKEACLFFYCYDNNKEKFKQAYRIAIQKYSTNDGKKTIWDNLHQIVSGENIDIIVKIKLWFEEKCKEFNLPSEEQSLANIKEVREKLNISKK
jgi:hypothetical protein